MAVRPALHSALICAKRPTEYAAIQSAKQSALGCSGEHSDSPTQRIAKCDAKQPALYTAHAAAHAHTEHAAIDAAELSAERCAQLSVDIAAIVVPFLHPLHSAKHPAFFAA